ncbi:AAA family ATPase [Kitasatospora sp. NPDC059673]|uniref:AAA family ATPase n=1 Tax=Kitasatospora sp. NPDC059673 TaxID=3346901 RepID=UPI003694E5C8
MSSTSEDTGRTSWGLFRGDGVSRPVARMPEAPPWRRFGAATATDGPPVHPYRLGPAEADIVNAALHLRRPLLVTGKPGTGKSSLAYALAHELGLGEVLHWPINSRSTLQAALYRYDAIGRLRESARPAAEGAGADADPGEFVHLGPVGTALVPGELPRVLLVDELDKGDIDLPNDLLTVFENGFFDIPELARSREDAANGTAGAEVTVRTADPDGPPALVRAGRITCTEFPVVVITSNGEREFPPAFLRRCLRLDLPEPDRDRLLDIIGTHLGSEALGSAEALLDDFLARRAEGELATDQLLNAVFLRHGGAPADRDHVHRAVLRSLGEGS